MPRRTSVLPVPPAADEIFTKAAADAAQKSAYPALAAIVRCVRAAAQKPFAEGEAVEARRVRALVHSPSSKALRHLFFAEREAAKIPGLPRDTALRPVKRVGIVGAGTMGGGIAMNFANAGIPAVIVEVGDAALQRGLGLVRKNYEASAAKGKLTSEQVQQRMGLLSGSLDYASLADCDLVIEAVFEDLALKKQVCAKLGATVQARRDHRHQHLDARCRRAGRRPPAGRRCAGHAFLQPGQRDAPARSGARRATPRPRCWPRVMKLAATIGKVAVVSGVCYGFIGNRMAEVYMREAEFLLMEGAEPQADRRRRRGARAWRWGRAACSTWPASMSAPRR